MEDIKFTALLKDLKSNNSDIRLSAVQRLRDYADVKAIPHLISCLDDGESSLVEQTAIEALIKIGDKSIVDTLLRKLTSPEKSRGTRGSSIFTFQKNAASVLASIGGFDLVPELLPLLSNSNPAARRASLRVLGKIRDPESLPHIIRVIQNDPIVDVRLTAIVALSRWDVSVAPILRTIIEAQKENLELKIAAVNTLGDIRDVDSLSLLDHTLKLERYVDKAELQFYLALIENIARLKEQAKIKLLEQFTPVFDAALATLAQRMAEDTIEYSIYKGYVATSEQLQIRATQLRTEMVRNPFRAADKRIIAAWLKGLAFN